MQPNDFSGNTSSPNNPGLLRADPVFSDLVVETTGSPIIVIDDRSQILYVNPACERLFGYSHSELIGSPVSNIIPESLRNRHEQALDRYMGTGERKVDWEYFEASGQHKDGSILPLGITFPGRLYIAPVKSHHTEHLFAIRNREGAPRVWLVRGLPKNSIQVPCGVASPYQFAVTPRIPRQRLVTFQRVGTFLHLESKFTGTSRLANLEAAEAIGPLHDPGFATFPSESNTDGLQDFSGSISERIRFGQGLCGHLVRAELKSC